MAFDIGTVTYSTVDGSIAFPTNSRTKFTSTPEMDATGRTIKWTKCNLTIECYLSAGDVLGGTPRNTDNEFAFVRRVLETVGGQLRIQNKGVGASDINVHSSYKRDVDWGPFPKMLSWAPLGNVSLFCVWEVEWKEHSSQFAASLGITEFSWSSRFDLDQDGATIRTISGFLSVVGTRQGNLAFVIHTDSNADSYREAIRVECPLGFVRDKQTYDVNPAKNRLDFTIVDRQLPHESYPPGISDMDCDFDLDTTTDRGVFTRFIFSFTGTAKAALGHSKSLALKALRDEHDFRFAMLLKNLKTNQGSIIPLPARFRVHEKTKGADARRVQLSLAWILTVVPNKNNKSLFPQDILTRTGFFLQNENSAEEWRNSMNNALGWRGHAGLEVGPQEDEIIDLRRKVGKNNPHLPYIGGGRRYTLPFGKSADEMPFIPPQGAYHDYLNDLFVITNKGRVAHFTVGSDPNSADLLANDIDLDRSKYVMQGYAIRYYEKPAIPVLKTVNRIPVIPIGSPLTRTYFIKSLNGVPIYRSDWEITYIPKNPKAALKNDPVIENPVDPNPAPASGGSNIDAPSDVDAG